MVPAVVHWALWAGERRVSCGRRPLTSVASACQQQLLLLLRRPAGSLIYIYVGRVIVGLFPLSLFFLSPFFPSLPFFGKIELLMSKMLRISVERRNSSPVCAIVIFLFHG